MKKDLSDYSFDLLSEARGRKKNGIHKQLRKMVRQHDLTHEFSDDYGAYRRGSDEKYDIDQKARRIPKKNFAHIWNNEADRKLKKPHNRDFHIKEDVEDLHELRNKTLWNYWEKARPDPKRKKGADLAWTKMNTMRYKDTTTGPNKVNIFPKKKPAHVAAPGETYKEEALFSLNENIENLHEVSKKLMARYLLKASEDAKWKNRRAAYHHNAMMNTKKDSDSSDHYKKWQKTQDIADRRERGIDMVARKLMREENEEINEVSKNLLKRYVQKAVPDAVARIHPKADSRNNWTKSFHRSKYIGKARKKIMKEE